MRQETRRGMGCFLIGATGDGVTKTGEALIGSVSDDPYDVRTFVRVVNPENAQSHIGTELISTSEHTLSERGYFASTGETTRGVNQSGLSFTCAMVFETETPNLPSPYRPLCDLTHDLMVRCNSVSDAITLLEMAAGTEPPVSILLADANGDLAQLEIGSFGVSVNHHFTRTQPGMVFAVNCYLSPKLAPQNAAKAAIEDERNNNRARRHRGKQLAEAERGKLDVPAFARILSDHANEDRDPLNNPLLPAWGYSICNHGTRHRESYPPEDLPWGTVSAEILQPSTRTLWYAYGWPCGRAPEYGDQLYQDRSWGEFLPFSLRETKWDDQEIIELTTAAGELTDAARRE